MEKKVMDKCAITQDLVWLSKTKAGRVEPHALSHALLLLNPHSLLLITLSLPTYENREIRDQRWWRHCLKAQNSDSDSKVYSVVDSET